MDNSSKGLFPISKWIFYTSFTLSIVVPLLFPLDPSFGFYGFPSFPSFLLPIFSPALNSPLSAICFVSLILLILYCVIALLIPQVWAVEAIMSLVTVTSNYLGANGLTLVVIRFVLMVLMSIYFVFLIRRLSASSTRKSSIRVIAIVLVITALFISCLSIYLTSRHSIFLTQCMECGPALSIKLSPSLSMIDIIGRGILGASFSVLFAYLLLEFREGIKRKRFQKPFLRVLNIINGTVAIILFINFLSVCTLPLNKGLPYAIMAGAIPMIPALCFLAKTIKMQHLEVEDIGH